MKAKLKETGKIIDVYQVAYPGYKNRDITDLYEYDEEDLEFIYGKKRYIIELVGNGYSYSERYLTDDEYNMLKEIIDDLENEYETVTITHIPEIGTIYKKLNLDHINIITPECYYQVKKMIKELYPDESSTAFFDKLTEEIIDIEITNRHNS